MVIRTKPRNPSIKAPLGLCLLAGAATGTLVAILTTTVTTPAVHADAELSRPAVVLAADPPTAATPSPAASPTPAFLAPKIPPPETAAKKRLDIIHGLASWYGGVFNGRKTASGEKYDMNRLTACHPTLPFGSLVRVINRANKRSVVVRINDRGDLIDEGRVIDLSWAAAEKLAMTKSGLAKVDVEVLSRGDSRPVK
jgi:rare lipoprotein A